jgi:hypothetical protein
MMLFADGTTTGAVGRAGAEDEAMSGPVFQSPVRIGAAADQTLSSSTTASMKFGETASAWAPSPGHQDRGKRVWRLLSFLVAAVVGLQLYQYSSSSAWGPLHGTRVPLHAAATLARCRALDVKPGPPADFHRRVRSDRFVPGTKPVLLRNARIWTGERNGTEVVKGSILLGNGIIQAIGGVPERLLAPWEDLEVYDLDGAWVTPGSESRNVPPVTMLNASVSCGCALARW